ncbi:MAG: hypothetical protein ACXVX9_08595, partial [Mycobacteriaceae bacterium]
VLGDRDEAAGRAWHLPVTDPMTVRDLMERYELRYVSGPLHQQVASAWKQVITLSLPNGAWESARNDPAGVARQGINAAAHYGAKNASRLLRRVAAKTASQARPAIARIEPVERSHRVIPLV